MDSKDTLKRLLPLFTRYYNVEEEDVREPFDATAVFKNHNEQYVLVKAAHIADIDSNEYVYFASCENLDKDKLLYYDKCAWEQGRENIEPYYGHRNSDVTLIVTADTIEEDTVKIIRKLHHSATYKFGMYGWSNYRLAVIECTKKRAFFNHHGRSLKKLVNSIIS